MAVISIYSTRTNRCRRVIRDDNDSVKNLIANHPIVTGESVVEIPASIKFNQRDIQRYLNNLNGKSPINDRYALVRGKIVEGIIIADTDIDSVQGLTMIEAPTAELGDRLLNDGTFVWPKARIDARIAMLEAYIVDLDASPVLADRTRIQMNAQKAEAQAEIDKLLIDRTAQ